jgi:superfamily II DNA or RNA helicase
MIDRWNVFENKPIREVGELCHIMRKVVNSDISRIHAVEEIIRKHPKVIIFYNFDYELEMLRTIGTLLNIPVGEWNGHNHQSIPRADSWVYLVQYTAGAEGWNCIETDTTIFFSQSYSYKTMVQASGRIDRVNTPFRDLYYYHIRSNSPIDLAIRRALRKKQDFNINSFEED